MSIMSGWHVPHEIFYPEGFFTCKSTTGLCTSFPSKLGMPARNFEEERSKHKNAPQPQLEGHVLGKVH